MNKDKFCLIVVLFLSLSGTVLFGASEITLFIAGDSIAAKYSAKVRPLCGWGEILPECFTTQVQVENRAAGGASTRTFVDWGKWSRLVKSLGKGDYLLIAFGHNDEKTHNIKKYSDPDTIFQENLKKFINEAKNAGAYPILLTPPVRLLYDKKSKKLRESHVQSLWHAPAGTKQTSTTYHDAVRKVAKETDVPLLDLNKRSHEAISALPDYETMTTYYCFVKPGHSNYPKGKKDITHLSIKGAALMAKCIADELQRIKSPLAAFLKKDITVEKLEQEFKSKHQ
jgi:lysophospholipase L1-like esterase